MTLRDRRRARFATLDAAVAHARRLLEDGYEAQGRWTLGQACRHLAQFTEASLDGFEGFRLPRPIAAMVRPLIVNGFVLSRPMPRGLPTLRSLTPPAVSDEDGLAAFAEACGRFDERFTAGGPFAYEPFLGELSPETWRVIHRMHATHHLAYLRPNGSA